MRNLTFSLVLFSMAACVGPAFAQHAGDIEVKYDSGAIVFNNGEPGYADGTKIFEGEMGVGGLFDGYSDEPGFISEIDIGLGLQPNDIIDYEVLNSRFGYFLNYYNPLTGMVESTSSTLTIDDNPGGGLVVSALGGGGTGSGVIGQADGLGDFHSHIGFTLSPGSDFGAYALLMNLNTTAAGIGGSQPFYIVFGYGITESEHEDAIAYFAGSAVPEPGTGLLALVSGLFGATRFRQRRFI